jgi:hypothetical protein
VAGDVEVAQVQGGNELVQVGGEGVVVILAGRPAGFAEAAIRCLSLYALLPKIWPLHAICRNRRAN